MTCHHDLNLIVPLLEKKGEEIIVTVLLNIVSKSNLCNGTMFCPFITLYVLSLIFPKVFSHSM